MNARLSQQLAPRLAGKAQGFSVVEVMVSLVLGLVVVAGVSQVYLGSKQSYRLNEARSRMQEDARFVLQFLSKYIRLAGYRSVPLPDQTPFPANSPLTAAIPKFSDGQVVTGLYGSAGAASLSSLSVRYQGRSRDGQGLPVLSGGTVESTVTDCLGSDLGSGALAMNTFSVDTANHELQCTAFNGTAGSTTTQPIVGGFGNLTVLYGLDTDDDGPLARSANRYVAAANVTNWLTVTSVKISFELRSTEDNLALTPTTYSFNGANVTDRRLRNRFELTVSLRNVLP